MMSRPMQNMPNMQPAQGGQGMNVTQMIQLFPQFMQQMRGKNPMDLVNPIISSGNISQDQLNFSKQVADQISEPLNPFKSMFGFK